MLAEVGFALGAVLLVLIAAAVSRRLGLPSPVLLVAAGVVYAELPGPNVALDPDLVLVLVIPPLLYSAALQSSLLELRRRLRGVVSLSVILVLVTAFAVAGAVDAVVPGLPLAAAIAMGAAVAPPDPVTALSVARQQRLPRRLMTLIEGEGLLNDATALTLYTVAVAAVAGEFSVPIALGRFVLSVLGGLACGVAVAGLIRLLRQFLSDPRAETTLSLMTPFAAYLPAEAAGTSGVLAVVVAGLLLGHQAPRLLSASGRLQIRGTWNLVDLLLEGFVFLLIGQQLPNVLDGLRGYSTGRVVAASVVAVLATLLVRAVYLIAANSVPRLRPKPPQRLSARELVVLWWSGMRGVVSLAAAFAIPLTGAGGHPFPGRSLLLFCAYVVVLVTLIGQGLTFAPLVRHLGVRADESADLRQRNEARLAAINAGLGRLEAAAAEQQLSPGEVERMRAFAEQRERRARARLAALENEGEEPLQSQLPLAALRMEMIEAERQELLRRRNVGRLSEDNLRLLQRELDLEEELLPALHSPMPRPVNRSGS